MYFLILLFSLLKSVSAYFLDCNKTCVVIHLSSSAVKDYSFSSFSFCNTLQITASTDKAVTF